MVTEQNSLEEIQEYFAQDRFATVAGCTIVEARAGYSVCEMPVTPDVLNANGTVMGGAMFTLGDFAMAVASNLDEKPTVAIAGGIRFFAPGVGEKLVATCKADKAGRRIGFYTITIENEQGKLIASMETTCHRS